MYTLASIPAFALHAPAYDSYPVARPYGYSPCAYPPGMMRPEREPTQAQGVYNPHVPTGPA